MQISTDVAGDYTFTFIKDGSASNMRVLVKYPCATAGQQLYKFEASSSMGTGNVASSSNQDIVLTTDGNKLTSLAGGTLTGRAEGSNNRLQYATDAFLFTNGERGVLRIDLDCPLQTGDKIRYINKSDDASKNAYVRHTSSTTTTNQLTLDGNKSSVTEIVVPAAFNNLSTIYITRGGADGALISYIQIIRPYTVTHTLTNATTSSPETAVPDENYTAVYAADDGYELPDAVTVMRGATNITASCTWTKASGTLFIPAAQVTGNITITVTGVTPACSAPTSPSISGTTAYTVGEDIELEASATGTSSGVTEYTWYKGANWAAASATTPVQATSTSGATLTISSCVTGDAGTYWCNISNGTGCDVQVSQAITVSKKTPTDYSVSGTASICSGDDATITLADSEDGLYYQLYNGESTEGDPVEGTGEALEWTVDDEGTYTVKAVADDTYSAATMSGSAVISFYDAVSIDDDPTAAVNANVGEATALSGLTLASGTFNSVSYQWQTCSDATPTSATAITSGDQYANYTTAAMSFTPASAGTYYFRCKVTDGCGTTVYSNVVTVTAKSAITLGDHDNGSVAITDGSSPITSAAEGEIVYLEATPNTGYAFRSWTVTPTAGGDPISVIYSWQPSAHFTMPDVPVTVAATFTQVSYSIMPNSIIHFEYTTQVGDGEASRGYKSAHYGDVITLAQTSIASGYHLKTWGVTKTASGDEVTMESANTFVMPAEDVTINPIVGKWYTVTFDANTGDEEDNPASITQTAVDGAITMPAAPTKSGYTFVNWMIGGTTVAAEGSYTPPTDVTAYATWKENCAGGSGTEVYNGENVAKGSTTASGWTIYNSSSMALQSGSSNGYSYWYQATSNTTDYVRFNGSASLASGDKIKIKWTHTSASDRTLQLNINGSSASLTSGSTAKSSTLVEAVYDVTSTVTVTSINLQSSGASGCIIYQVSIVKAGGASCYYVTYDGNGAAGGYTNDETAYASGTTVTVATNENNHFTHPGYSFTGWNTRADGEGTGYAAGATFSISENTTLYAQWTPAVLTFTGAVDFDWTDPANWTDEHGVTPACVPTIEHDVIIDNHNVRLYGAYSEDRKGHGVAKSIKFDKSKVGHQSDRLEIWSQACLIVQEGITVKHEDDADFGPTLPSDLIIETSVLGNGVFICGAASDNTQATYEFYSKAWKSGKWYINQYVGIPVEDVSTSQYWGFRVFVYNPEEDAWANPTSSELEPFTAYNLLASYNQSVITDRDITGTLILPGTTGEGRKHTFTCGSRYNSAGTFDGDSYEEANGDYLFANSWTAPVDISSLDESDYENIEPSIYIFNAGYVDPEGSQREIGELCGQWSCFPFSASTYMDNAVIPATQAFNITAKAPNATLTLDYKKHVYDPAVNNGYSANNYATRAPKRINDSNAPIKLKMVVRCDSTIADQLYIFERGDFSEAFDNGWDGRKIYGKTTSPQIYATCNANPLAVLATSNMDGTQINFRKGSQSDVYTISFEYDGETELYLIDLKELTSTLISNENTYEFMSETGDNEQRFYISESPYGAPTVTTGIENTNKVHDSKVSKVLINDHIYIIRGGKTYSVDGTLVK